MTLEEEIMKLDLIASDAFEGGNKNEFIQLAEWLRELKARRRIDKLDHIIRKTAQYQMPEDLDQMRNEIKELEKYVEEVQNES